LLASCCICSANEIDGIKTDSDVIHFVNRFLPKGTTYTLQLGTTGEYMKERLQQLGMRELDHIFDSLGVADKAWIKADINNDGKTDLIVFTEAVLLVIYTDHDSFCKAMNGYVFKYNFIFPGVKLIDGQNLMLLYSLRPLLRKEDSEVVACDTLIFRDGQIFNYLKTPKHYDIEKITFHDDGSCEGDCIRVDIAIDNKLMKGSFAAGHSLYSNENRTGEVNKEKIARILEFLNYSNFPDLKETYSSGWTDQTTVKWEITYNNGQVKTISDYGECGSATLNTLYAFLVQDIFNEFKD